MRASAGASLPIRSRRQLAAEPHSGQFFDLRVRRTRPCSKRAFPESFQLPSRALLHCRRTRAGRDPAVDAVRRNRSSMRLVAVTRHRMQPSDVRCSSAAGNIPNRCVDRTRDTSSTRACSLSAIGLMTIPCGFVPLRPNNGTSTESMLVVARSSPTQLLESLRVTAGPRGYSSFPSSGPFSE